MRVISSFCSALITRFAVERERLHRRQVVEGEEHRLAVRAVPVPGPRRHAEDVLLRPLEALAADLRPAAARGDLVDLAARVADRFRILLYEIEPGAHRRHHRAA